MRTASKGAYWTGEERGEVDGNHLRIGHNVLWQSLLQLFSIQVVKCGCGGMDTQRKKRRREAVKHGVRQNMLRSQRWPKWTGVLFFLSMFPSFSRKLNWNVDLFILPQQVCLRKLVVSRRLNLEYAFIDKLHIFAAIEILKLCNCAYVVIITKTAIYFSTHFFCLNLIELYPVKFILNRMYTWADVNTCCWFL